MPLLQQLNVTIIKLLVNNKWHNYSHLVLCHIFPDLDLAAYSVAGTSTFVIGKDVLWKTQQSHKSKALVWLLQHSKVGKEKAADQKHKTLKVEKVGEIKRFPSTTNLMR